MANVNPNCVSCGQPLSGGRCTNKKCASFSIDPPEGLFGSLVPEDILSIDPTQIIDYTGTIGVNPGDVDSAMAHESLGPEDDDSSQTRMVDDEFYQQIQTFFPAESASGSGSGSERAGSDDLESSNRDSDPDASQSLSIRGLKDNFSVEEFVPPVRDIQFPSDTASLEQIREARSDAVEGDEYHIVEKLGEGGYGVVFEAEQMALNRPVAVKVLKPKRKKPGSQGTGRSGTGTGELQRRRDQFLHEAKITARLQHPNIVPLYDFGINKRGELFYSMKKVERRPWSSVIHNVPKLLDIPEDQVDATAEREAINKNIEIFDRVCDAMAYSHAKQIIHRDLKPDNIMIGDYGEVLLIDFGMALDFAAGQPEFSAGGTLVYMSPEMAAHFAKQKEIQVAAQKTAKRLGMEQGSVFLDQSNLLGIGNLAKKLIAESQDKGVIELAETLVRLDSQEKQLAAKISYCSDIYLLGAILYQIAVGHPPHFFPIAACKQGRKEKFQKELWLALKNGFQQYQKISDPLRISLRNIAVKAMRTEPEKRFQTVEELQEAIKDFQLQVQSLEMTETGKAELDKAEGGDTYQHLLPALESFRGASALWPEGRESQNFQVQAACEYANRAHSRKDYDAGLSILDEYVTGEPAQSEPVVELRDKLIDGKRKRARNRRLAVAGWFAAIALPIAVFFSVSALSAKRIADANLIAEQKKREAEEQTQLAIAQKAIAAEQTAIANEKTRVATEQTQLAQEKTQLAQEKTTLAEMETARAEAEKAKADANKAEAERQSMLAMTKTMEAEEATRKAAEATTKANEARIAAQEAQIAATQSKLEASKFKFDADLGVYNTNVLSIPLDFRTSKLDAAAEKLKQLQDSAAKAYLKNGWLVRHFGKRVDVFGTNAAVAPNARIVDLVSRPTANSVLAVGRDENGIRVWEMNPQGATQALELGLPDYGDVVDLTISPDGQWLALALDNVGEQAALWVVNLTDGKRLPLGDEAKQAIVGCRNVQFTGDNELVSVEELTGYRGLKERVQVVLRRIAGSELTVVASQSIPATTRDEGRVQYLATTQNVAGRTEVAIAFKGLSDEADEESRLVTVSGQAGGLSTNPDTVLSRFPTAIHVDPQGKVFAGFADGKITRFPAQVSGESTELTNFNEDEIAALATTANGQLISASKNGVLIFWNDELNAVAKRLDGQTGELTSLALGESDPANGVTMFTGDDRGFIRYWLPETNQHSATVRKPAAVTVTAGAIDQGLDAGAVPATAYGNTKGQVFYYDSAAMTSRSDGKLLKNQSSADSAKFKFRSPFESFGTAFNDFDSMGIVDDHFVLLKNDGTFYSSLIDTSTRQASPQSNTIDLSGGQRVSTRFLPLLASVTNQDYFFSSNPRDEDGLIFWKKTGEQFTPKVLSPQTTSRGSVRRLSLSPDGKWLAVVRHEMQDQSTGEYQTEIYDVSSADGNLQLSTVTNPLRVGDPAFVGFSADSQRMLQNFHKLGVDRETWLEQWDLGGQTWRENRARRTKIDDRKVDVVDWEGDDQVKRLVTKINKDYFLVDMVTPGKESLAFVGDGVDVRDKLRSVRPTGDGDSYYVLSSKGLNLYTGTRSRSTDSVTDQFPQIEDARDIRVFGNRAILLDRAGFHLIESVRKDDQTRLQYVTMLATREVAVSQVALSGGRLAIVYDNGFCRIWNVQGDRPVAIGTIENAASVQLSPDAKWAVCKSEGQVRVFPIDSQFDRPQLSLPFANLANVSYQWTRRDGIELLLAEAVDGKVTWSQFDPANGIAGMRARADLPAEISGLRRFALAPATESYIAIETDEQLQLWLTGEEPKRFTEEDNRFDVSGLNKIESIAFSEIAMEEEAAIGTRLVVLANDGTGNAKSEPVIFVLAKEDAETAEELEQEPRFQAVKIDGALETTDDRVLLDVQFSGDSRSLLEVDKDGISTLLSK